MSGNGRWIAFIRAPEAPAKADGAASGEMLGKGDGNLDKAVGKEGQQEAKTAAGEPRNAAVLVEVASGRETVIANIKRFAFGGKDGEWIVLHGYGVDKAGALALLQRLGAEPALPLPLGEVDQFAFDEAGARLAWSTRSADGTGNALQLRQLDSGVTRVLDAQAGAVYRNLSWSKDGHALAALREVEGGEDEPADRALLAFIGLDEIGSASGRARGGRDGEIAVGAG